MVTKTIPAKTKTARTAQPYESVHGGIVDLLQSARLAAARSVNALMTASYWEIGRRIAGAEQKSRSDVYGKQLIQQLSIDLTQQFGRGFGWRNLAQMRSFYLAWPVEKILQTVSAKSFPAQLQQLPSLSDIAKRFPLPWSAYVAMLSVKNPQARAFYEAEALRGGWSIRQLDRQINTQFFERTALSRNKAAMLTKGMKPKLEDAMAIDEVVKDPFVLEFLNLKDEYSETDLEDALIRKLEDFLLELGDDFTFVGRQKRLRLDDAWFRVDLTFFHRRLRCLVLIDLKLGKFSHADAGQMHLYLNYAKAHWTRAGENPPVGLILCSQKGAAEAHYALEGLSSKVLAAEYQTILPSAEVIEKELNAAVRMLALKRKVKPLKSRP
ncbi:MAG: PDDEXK nuclease domain-containing protein [Cytophagales bacterium]|nr:PDDEXK nuclease domain-containing protein [Cytophagales bacterium]